ncbi:hypothetical protein E1287_07050 [Actinomadura sp. KC06]|uniref:hypothetical protein n=1 Tax=Actinomadura sp. KC06 TaxID=2530369 RepID=UPI001047ABD8|nr:hypothetical protein [Actinomadura sp. KC06]TDD37810.1 hypothetical protein E1287_07050 [Actinomadura sp. KC06]
MAYVERRGDYYRGRFKNPPGVKPRWGTVSETLEGWPFTEKQKALDAANDKESWVRGLVGEWRRLVDAGHAEPTADGVTFERWLQLLQGLRRRANGGRDPNAGDISLEEYVHTTWWPAQDLEVRTDDQYSYRLRRMILPAYGHRPVNTLTDEAEIAAWELGLRVENGGRYAQSTAADSRSLLATILGDAKAAGLVDDNAAARRRGRGKKKNRQKGRRRRAVGKQWATPLEVILIAERCSLLTGQDDDFVMWVTAAWCGLRWGEVIGLELENFRLSKLHLEWQLGELNGKFYKCDPKDEAFRNDDPEFFGALDLPPFLSDLLSTHVQRRRPRPCRCRYDCGAGPRLLFLGAEGGHPSRSDYSRRYWRPACDGVFPGEDGKRERPARPVLVDAAAGFPGAPLKPAWPYAEGDDWEPPRGKGWQRWDVPAVDAFAVACPVPACTAAIGKACLSGSGRETAPHRPRRELAVSRGHVTERALASWLPVRTGFTRHELRHAQKTWMIEDRIPDVMSHDRLGHVFSGIGATYSHVTDGMRQDLKVALQTRWETALSQRAQICPHSPVRLVDELLVPHREPRGNVVSHTSPNHAKGPVSRRGERAFDLGGAEGI